MTLRLPLAFAFLASAAFGAIAADPVKKDGPPPNPPNLFAAPAKVRPLRIAIYSGPGSGENGVAQVTQRVRQLPGSELTPLTPEEIGTRDLSAVFAPFGRGRVLTISPHSEDTPGLENIVPRAIAWLGEK